LQLQTNRALMENRLARRELETGFIILWTDGAWREQRSSAIQLVLPSKWQVTIL
jgi:hypothetical protein